MVKPKEICSWKIPFQERSHLECDYTVQYNWKKILTSGAGIAIITTVNRNVS